MWLSAVVHVAECCGQVHVAVVSDQSTAQLFMDGKLAAELNATGGSGGSVVYNTADMVCSTLTAALSCSLHHSLAYPLHCTPLLIYCTSLPTAPYRTAPHYCSLAAELHHTTLAHTAQHYRTLAAEMAALQYVGGTPQMSIKGFRGFISNLSISNYKWNQSDIEAAASQPPAKPPQWPEEEALSTAVVVRDERCCAANDVVVLL